MGSDSRTRRQGEKLARKADKRALQLEKQQKEEAAKWQDEDKHVRRKENRAQEAQRKKDEQQRRKQELKALEREEAAQLAGARSCKSHTPKLTRLQIQERLEGQAKLERRLRDQDEDEDLLQPNFNHLLHDVHVHGSGVDEALSALGASGVERHPEKRFVGAWNRYVEAHMEAMREECPGLRASQYREMLWKRWPQSPENPFNQEHQPYNGKARASSSSDSDNGGDVRKAVSPLPTLSDEQVQGMSKKDLVVFLQKHAAPQFLSHQGMGGSVKSVVKRKRQDELLGAYWALRAERA